MRDVDTDSRYNLSPVLREAQDLYSTNTQVRLQAEIYHAIKQQELRKNQEQ